MLFIRSKCCTNRPHIHSDHTMEPIDNMPKPPTTVQADYVHDQHQLLSQQHQRNVEKTPPKADGKQYTKQQLK